MFSARIWILYAFVEEDNHPIITRKHSYFHVANLLILEPTNIDNLAKINGIPIYNDYYLT